VDFFLAQSSLPVALLAGGVGPILNMLETIWIL
jgi:hypothetical protein